MEISRAMTKLQETCRALGRRLERFVGRWMWLREYEISLNRRAEVEQELFDAARGKRPLPDAEQCRKLAVRLGVPDKWKDIRNARVAAPTAPHYPCPDGCAYRGLVARFIESFDKAAKFNADIVQTGKSSLDPNEDHAEYLEIVLEAKALLKPNEKLRGAP